MPDFDLLQGKYSSPDARWNYSDGNGVDPKSIPVPTLYSYPPKSNPRIKNYDDEHILVQNDIETASLQSISSLLPIVLFVDTQGAAELAQDNFFDVIEPGWRQSDWEKIATYKDSYLKCFKKDECNNSVPAVEVCGRVYILKNPEHVMRLNEFASSNNAILTRTNNIITRVKLAVGTSQERVLETRKCGYTYRMLR